MGLSTFGDPGSQSSAGDPEEVLEVRAKEPKKAGEPAAFILGEALPVVPARLVRKILNGEFVDMAELLRDNMEAERRRAGQEKETGLRVGRREIPDMLSWLHCFSLYAAIIGSKYPEKMRELWAYQALMIGEQRRCGGRGWLLYDAAFRQQITSLETADFSQLNQSLYLTTFVAYGGKGQSCANCLLSDHAQDECALQVKSPGPIFRRSETPGGPRGKEEKGRRRRRGACYAWNDGKCTTPYCRFDHVCSRCYGEHKRSVCGGGQIEERGGGRARGPEQGN